MSVRLYIGNLPKDLDRKELGEFFDSKEVVDLTSTKVVTDRKTGKCRGFGFVTVETEEQADDVIAKLNGQEFDGHALKIEKALPKTKENANTAEQSGVSNDNSQKVNNNRRANKGNKARNANLNRGGSQAQSAQPDPRWADELEKLKEMLLAQSQA